MSNPNSSNTSRTFSLVISTRGRGEEISRLLRSLEAQTCQSFEVIIVEQNHSATAGAHIPDFLSFPVTYLHRPGQVGCSRGRNTGLPIATGRYVIFPDDDCWYPPNFLELAERLIEGKQLQVLTGRPVAEDGRPIQGRFEATATWISRSNVWTTLIEWLAVWRRDLIEEIGGFDVDVGVGATTPWQSAEGQDLLLRALQAGARCYYDPRLIGHDEDTDRLTASDSFIRKQRSYARGMTYVMRKHRLGMPIMAYYVCRAAAGAGLAMMRGRPTLARFHIAAALGRVEGILGRTFGDSDRPNTSD
jgi:glycosyltransferase involved in cell wall biosynthesis